MTTAQVSQWRTREGVRIALPDMTDLHLRNAIRFVKRKIEDAEDDEAATYGASCSGEAATYYAAGAQDDATAKVIGLRLALDVLEREQKRRGC